MSLSSHRTLILNSTFQPLSVVSFKRAISLMHNNKINIIKNSEIILRSEKEEFFIPKVGILTYFVKAPFARRVALNRENIFIRDYFTCQYCGKAAESIDHIVPRSKGGLHEWSNVVACCKKCNLIKADKLLHQTHLNLKKTPGNPKDNFWIKTIVAAIQIHPGKNILFQRKKILSKSVA